MDVKTKGKKTLKVGEKYLSVVVDVLGQPFKMAAFKNTQKQNENSPDYRGKNIAIWIASKQPPKDKGVDEL